MSDKTPTCDECGGTEGLFRAIRQAQSANMLYACCGECEAAIRTKLETEYEPCERCMGKGTVGCDNPACDECVFECNDCEGAGIVERDEEWSLPADAVVH